MSIAMTTQHTELAQRLEIALAQVGLDPMVFCNTEDCFKRLFDDFEIVFLDYSIALQQADFFLDLEHAVLWVAVLDDFAQAAEAYAMGAGDIITPLASDEHIRNLCHRVKRYSLLQQSFKNNREALEQVQQDLELNYDTLSQDQQAGRLIQQHMLPETPWQFCDALFEHQVIPSLYLSGDYVDYFPLNEHKVLLMIADVAGHGSSSAFITVLLKNQLARVKMIIDANHHDVEPHWVLSNVNNELLAMNIEKHVTAVAAVLDFKKNVLTWSIAGHLPGPLLARVSDEGVNSYFLSGEGFPLGLFANAEYTSQRIELTEHFSLSLFSDGVLEIGRKGESLERREAWFSSLQKPGIFTLQDWQRELGLRSIVEPPDDITLLIVSR